MELGKVIVEGATFLITADAPVVTTPTPAIPSHSLTVSSDANVTSEGKKAALKTDMEGQSSVGGIGYINPPYVIPGVLEWDGVLGGSQESEKLTKTGSKVIVDDTNSGSVTFNVTQPAEDPTQPPPPPPCVPGVSCTPDTSSSYPGTWTLLDAGQTKLTTVE